jgi:hypothetical protein
VLQLGVSANLLYGFEPCNVQNNFRRAGARHRGSADDLVGLEEEGRGDREAEGLGRLEVDDELKLWGLLDREVTWLGAPQNLVDIDGPTADHVRHTRRVGEQAAGQHALSVPVERWQLMRESERYDVL